MSKDKSKSRKSYDTSILDFTFQVPRKGLKIDEYGGILLKLQDKDDYHSRNLGFVRWAQGQVLLRVRPLCKKKGSWGTFLRTIELGTGKTMAPETARLCMRTAKTIDRQQAKSTGYTQMLRMAYPSLDQTVKDDTETETTTRGKGSGRNLNGRKTGPIPSDQFRKRIESLLSESQELADRDCDDPDDSPTAAITYYKHLLGKLKGTQNEVAKITGKVTSAIAELQDSGRKAA